MHLWGNDANILQKQYVWFYYDTAFYDNSVIPIIKDESVVLEPKYIRNGVECIMPYTGSDYFGVQKGWAIDSNNITSGTLKVEFGLSNKKVYEQMMYVAKIANLGWINYDCLWQKDPIVQKVILKRIRIYL
jgi:hypothetical protein